VNKTGVITAILIISVLSLSFTFSIFKNPAAANNGKNDSLIYPGEKHFKNLRKLTSGGENAEAYFSYDGTKLVYQTTHGHSCDQIYTMNTDGSDKKLVSSGKGRTTCSYFFPGDSRILYASTFAGSEDCPPPPDYSKGYVWALYNEYDIYSSNADGSDIRVLTSSPGYDAEATISPKGDKIIFTSTRDGDLELYSMNLDGSGVKRLTFEPGYDGGAYYSYDGSMIVYRASRPEEGAELNEYKELLRQGLIRPNALEIFVMNADGSNKRQVTNNGAANFGPYFFPDGKRIIFCSNMGDPAGRNFDLWAINTDGTGLEQITFNDTFDGFPMFSMDGRKFVFCSNRHAEVKGETNVFVCDWVE
jgi:Tol biopolymer transport system component